jgi:hypothetical protein
VVPCPFPYPCGWLKLLPNVFCTTPFCAFTLARQHIHFATEQHLLRSNTWAQVFLLLKLQVGCCPASCCLAWCAACYSLLLLLPFTLASPTGMAYVALCVSHSCFSVLDKPAAHCAYCGGFKPFDVETCGGWWPLVQFWHCMVILQTAWLMQRV